MCTQDVVMKQRAMVEGAISARGAGWEVPLLCAVFVLSWAIEPELLGEGANFVPPIRWLIVVLMCVTVPFVSVHGIRRGWPIVFFVVTVGFTMFLNGALESSFPIFARILGAGILAIFVGTLAFSQRVKVIRLILVASVAVVIGSVVLSVVAPERAFRLIGLERERLYGLTPHPAVISYFASLVATVFGSVALFTKRNKAQRWSAGILAAVSATVIFMADSRTGEIAFAVSLLCQLGVIRLVNSRVLLRSIVVPWLFFAGAILASTTLPITVASDLMSVSVEENQYSGSTLARIAIWKLGLSDFESNMLVGNGLGTTFVTDDPSTDKNLLLYYHSVLINYLAKSGIVGAIGLVAILLSAPYTCLAYARRLARQRSLTQDEQTLLRFVVAACTVTVAFASIEAALQNLYPSFLIFFLSITLPPRAPTYNTR